MIKTEDLWGPASPVETAQKVEQLKAALAQSDAQYLAHKAAGDQWVPPSDAADGNGGWMVDPVQSAVATLEKSVSPELLASITTEVANLNKDVSLTSPFASGLVPFDLAPLALVIAPPLTPLRNKIPRLKGQGKARQYKRITGLSNSGTGGVANQSTFISDTSTMAAGSLTLRRGPVITYAADEKTISYKQQGLSDVMTWSAEFAGIGLLDPRGLSSTALLYASMIGDERAMLGGRGTDAGFVGAFTTPSTANITLTARNAGTNETGNTANIATLFVRISAEGMFGESIASAEFTTASMAAITGKVIDVTMTGAFVAGATGYRIYVGTVTGIANQFFLGRTGCWGGTAGQGTAAFTINFTGAGTGGTINAGVNGLAAESASSANAFDGIQSVQLDPTQSGAIRSVGGKFSTSSIGTEFQDVFAMLYTGGTIPGVTGTQSGANGVKARPTDIYMPGLDRKQLSAAFLSGGSGNPSFFFNVPSGDQGNMRMGQVVTGMLNEVTGDEVAITVHPWINQGTSLVLSSDLPYPDSGVPNLFEYRLPQDYIQLNWPVIQHTYDVGSYWFGSLIQYGPMFSGAVTNVLAG